MSFVDAAFLFVAGFLSGVVNAIAGGGTFLTFGAMTLIGLPPIVANATSSITQFPGYVTSAMAYWREIRSDWKEALKVGVLSLIGGVGGSLLLISMSNPGFRALVPWLLLVATAIFAAGPLLRPKHLHAEQPLGPLGLFGQFATSIYGGFFGAGQGIMTLAVLGLSKGGDYHKLNALKNFLAMLIAAVAIIVFTSGDVVAWPQAAVMIPAGAIGGYSGVWVARRVPQNVIRALVVAVGGMLTIYYFATG
ncbi:sulfite exporter TauE/SafE family protein [Rhizobium sp. ARZ01]|uniref:sulfite exporter TauE/SafE family protein n=1 Tax=Rhizobium sp. ARZ01 TaxID=2769313 RepID=UPI00178702C8|nr:sulfite exporter TauE/SafE family protein [Rhizobium sp. ARZ01]MBD9374694.1 sulfite exporter TauE/SafE family protein [Rhizobium sp. ARZ01]